MGRTVQITSERTEMKNLTRTSILVCIRDIDVIKVMREVERKEREGKVVGDSLLERLLERWQMTQVVEVD